MKALLGTLALFALASTSFAGCGKTETDEGKVTSVNAEKKTITISVKGKEVTRTLTPTSTGADNLDALKGKKVTVVSSHGKVQSIKG